MICSEATCTSCGAYQVLAPKNCITFKTNEYGFDYPYIDTEKCINCGLCEKACHALNSVSCLYPQKAYAVWSNDDKDRRTSSSGGAASVFYRQALKMKGYCFGAAYDDDLKVVIKGFNDERIECFKQSKYVHSYMGDSFQLIKNELRKNTQIIFIGLPCQVAALRRYLGREYDNILLIDIICHGTPPYSHFLQHIEMIENKCGPKVTSTNFRNENEFVFSACSERKTIYQKKKDIDTYLLPFFESLNYYDACYNCRYARNKRCSDITIGDFWGLGIDEPFNHPYTGAISLVLTNTEKGQLFFDKAKKDLFWEERTVKEALKGNAQLNYPSVRNKKRERFLECYQDYGFEQAVLEVYGTQIRRNRKKIFINDIYTKARRVAKKVLGK